MITADFLFRAVSIGVGSQLFQEAKASAAAERSSKKHLSGRQAAKLWYQRVKAMKEQFGDKFEEC